MRKSLQTALVLKEHDYNRLTSLVNSVGVAVAGPLNAELIRADVVEDEDFPPDAVAMNATVKFQDMNTREETTVTLVYPHEANVEQMRISVLSPVGTALLGLRTGGVINWPMPGGKIRKLKVNRVTQLAERPCE